MADKASRVERRRRPVKRAEIVGEGFFIVRTHHVRIAFLLLAQQAFFGGEDRAGTVDID